jgi:SNF2 family DNA or RNA helicase
MKKPRVVITKRRITRNKGGGDSIIINPHQVSAVHKMITSGKKGILLWHMMGTGKTFSALTFILNYPNINVNILCPKELVFLWEAEIKRIPEIQNNITFFSYENSAEFFSRKSLYGELLVIDEIHNLPALLRKSKDVHKNLELMKTAHKVMALSGTPIYTDLADLAYIINICAGEEILPYTVAEFKQKFYKSHIIKSAIFGYGQQIIKTSGQLSTLVLGYQI